MTQRRKRLINAAIDGLFYSELGKVWGKPDWFPRLVGAHLNRWILQDVKRSFEMETA